MKVYLLRSAEYRWDIHEVMGVYSSQERATLAMNDHLIHLNEIGVPENRQSVYIEDMVLDESN